MSEQEEEGTQTPSPGETRLRSDFCVFVRGASTFALSTRFAREVLDPRPFTPVPLAPDALVGAFNLRGEVIPLVRLDRLLGVEERTFERSDALLVIGHGDLTLAAVVDRVEEIRHIAPWEVQRLASPERESNPLVRGTAGKEGQRVLVLDAERLLASVAAHIADGFRRRWGIGTKGRSGSGEASGDPARSVGGG